MAASTNIYGFNIGGNNNSFDQRGHFYRGVFSGNVTGMLVKQNSTPNMTVLVEHGSALLNKNTTSASIAEIKSDTSVTIDTANTSNPRIDTVVIYEDTSVAIPTVEANYWQDGAGGRFKIVSLPGTAAASPVALSDASIQTAIGAGKPWTRLADITVPTNSTTILNSNIADKRKVISPNVSNYGTAGVLTADANGNVSATSMFWEEIGRTTLSASGGLITISSLPLRKYLRIIITTQATGGTIRHILRLNNDTGSNYVYRYSANGDADGTVASQTNIGVDFSAGAYPYFIEIDVVNISSQEKLLISHSSEQGATGAANAPNRIEVIGKWANTSSQINRIDISNGGTGSFAAGSEVVVLGRN
jgi:hypothetical protein